MATEHPRAVWCCSTCGAIYHKDYPRCPADGAEVVIAERDPLLGGAIGHYTIEQLVGEGGMARVYLANHAHLPNKRYALKVLLGDHSASAAMRARFTREAERASQLDHPNVVKVVDFGQTRHGLLYIVMDYVDGPSLVSLIDQLPMEPARVIALSRAICHGLVYAHDAGIVHRDLKPENILVSSGSDGPVPRIVDFGLALSIEQGDARLTESGMTMGTPAFAAPEQLSGKPIDHRADLYALGVTMFEMLTGGLAPFEGNIFETMSVRTVRDAPRISERAPGLAIPRELEDIVARLTRCRPEERYASAREVIEALDRVPLGLAAPTPAEPIGNRRRSRWWGAAGAAVACAVAAAAWFQVSAGRGDAPPATPARVASPPVAPSTMPTAPAPDRAAAPAQAPGSAAPPTAAPAAPDRAAPPAAAAPDSAGSPTMAPAVPDRAVPPAAAPAQAAAGDRQPTAPSEHAPTRRGRRPRPGLPVVEVEPAAGPPPAEVGRVVEAPAAPAVPAVPAPPPRGELRATIHHIDVSGSLSVSAVRRAVERWWPAIARCTPGAPGTAVARFKIGEAKRAQVVAVTGASQAINRCIAAALTEVRTEEAPDVGDADVTVRIAFMVVP